MHYDAQRTLSKERAARIDELKSLTAAQLRERYGGTTGPVAIETVSIYRTPYEADIRLAVPVDDDAHPVAIGVLYRYGHEVACTRARDEFFGTWELASATDSVTLTLNR